MTQSGHPPERLTFPHEQEVTTVMASLADVGVLWGLLGGDHQRARRPAVTPGRASGHSEVLAFARPWRGGEAGGTEENERGYPTEEVPEGVASKGKTVEECQTHGENEKAGA